MVVSQVRVRAVKPVTWSIIAAIVFIAILPMFAPYGLSINILLFGLFALSYNIIHGHMGQVSFGHATFFGVAAYITALGLQYDTLVFCMNWIWVVAGIVGSGLLALGIGALVLKKRGAYFALTNLAFLQAIYFLMFQFKDVTGGSDGVGGFQVPFGLTGIPFYFVCFGAVVVCILLMNRIFNSAPFGLVLHAMREQEERTLFLGYNVFGHMLKAYTLSGIFAGVSGSLFVLYLGHVGVDTLSWLFAGEVIIV